MPQQTFVPAIDGFIFAKDATYNTAHDAASGTAATPYWNNPIASYFYNTNYSIFRTFLFFDTSLIPSGAANTSAALHVYQQAFFDDAGIDTGGNDVALVEATPASDSALVDGDFDECGAVDNPTEGAPRVTFNNTGTTGWRTFTLSATGRGWINRTGITVLGLRADIDADDTAPTDGVKEVALDISSMEYTNEAYLIVNYNLGKQPMPTFFRKTT